MSVTIFKTLPLGDESQGFDWAIAEAASLKVRSDLMLELQQCLESRGWTPVQAAQALGKTLPQMQNLMNGEVSRFTTEQLIQMLCKVGCHVQVSVTE
jgi:predicted XRE-type DNA-binding protein